MRSFTLFDACLVAETIIHRSSAFVALAPNWRKARVRIAPAAAPAPHCLRAVKIDGYEDSFRIIDESAVNGEPSDGLFDAVRFVDKNALKIYPTEEDKQALWNEAHGSWKLQLATGGGKFREFKQVPIFAYAMVDDQNFGNGIGFGEGNIILSLLGPHIFNTKRRQMTITIDDMFLFASKVTQYVPGFVRDGMGLGKRPEDMKRPPAFTFIGVSKESLIARGGTGGIAIWSRLSKDIRPAAYGSEYDARE